MKEIAKQICQGAIPPFLIGCLLAAAYFLAIVGGIDLNTVPWRN